LEELTPKVGTSIGFYLVEHPYIKGEDGEFMVCNGLQEGNWRKGQVARLENDIRRGDLYKGKKVKYPSKMSEKPAL